MVPPHASARGRAKRPKRRSRATRPDPRFVGRDASPVLDRYPPKESGFAPRPVPAVVAPVVSSPSPSSPPVAAPPPPTSGTAPENRTPLITLDRPFDLDDFASLLGETSIRVTVPREALPEVLRRATDFMGFGIYVYTISVRPSPGELLKSFVVELERVDYSPEKRSWVPFVDHGVGDSPYAGTGSSGPDGSGAP